ncbi:hypothetical protein DBR27_12520 [Flavobacterium sp. HMWF030]|nr:hypothetical protein DBR27_12520 [Flavobacterium sp. HMWF030]
MVFHEKVYELAKKYYSEALADKGLYEKIILKIILNKSQMALFLLVSSIKIGYHPKISEIIRNINNFKISKT